VVFSLTFGGKKKRESGATNKRHLPILPIGRECFDVGWIDDAFARAQSPYPRRKRLHAKPTQYTCQRKDLTKAGHHW
jgi:hypothetical protein